MFLITYHKPKDVVLKTYVCRVPSFCTSVETGYNLNLAPNSNPRPGTSDPEKCPIGTYTPNRGTTRKEDCLPCPAGFYCDLDGQYARDTVFGHHVG